MTPFGCRAVAVLPYLHCVTKNAISSKNEITATTATTATTVEERLHIKAIARVAVEPETARTAATTATEGRAQVPLHNCGVFSARRAGASRRQKTAAPSALAMPLSGITLDAKMAGNIAPQTIAEDDVPASVPADASAAAVVSLRPPLYRCSISSVKVRSSRCGCALSRDDIGAAISAAPRHGAPFRHANVAGRVCAAPGPSPCAWRISAQVRAYARARECQEFWTCHD